MVDLKEAAPINNDLNEVKEVTIEDDLMEKLVYSDSEVSNTDASIVNEIVNKISETIDIMQENILSVEKNGDETENEQTTVTNNVESIEKECEASDDKSEDASISMDDKTTKERSENQMDQNEEKSEHTPIEREKVQMEEEKGNDLVANNESEEKVPKKSGENVLIDDVVEILSDDDEDEQTANNSDSESKKEDLTSTMKEADSPILIDDDDDDLLEMAACSFEKKQDQVNQEPTEVNAADALEKTPSNELLEQPEEPTEAESKDAASDETKNEEKNEAIVDESVEKEVYASDDIELDMNISVEDLIRVVENESIEEKAEEKCDNRPIEDKNSTELAGDITKETIDERTELNETNKKNSFDLHEDSPGEKSLFDLLKENLNDGKSENAEKNDQEVIEDAAQVSDKVDENGAAELETTEPINLDSDDIIDENSENPFDTVAADAIGTNAINVMHEVVVEEENTVETKVAESKNDANENATSAEVVDDEDVVLIEMQDPINAVASQAMKRSISPTGEQTSKKQKLDEEISVDKSGEKCVSKNLIDEEPLSTVSADDKTEPLKVNEMEDKTSSNDVEALIEKEELHLEPEPRPKNGASRICLGFLKKFKKGITEMSRKDLEEFVTAKIVETISHKMECSELRRLAETQEKTIGSLRCKLQELSKQFRDLDMVHKRVMTELEEKNNNPISPVKITRAVGLQVCIQSKPVTMPGRTASVPMNDAPTYTRVISLPKPPQPTQMGAQKIPAIQRVNVANVLKQTVEERVRVNKEQYQAQQVMQQQQQQQQRMLVRAVQSQTGEKLPMVLNHTNAQRAVRAPQMSGRLIISPQTSNGIQRRTMPQTIAVSTAQMINGVKTTKTITVAKYQPRNPTNGTVNIPNLVRQSMPSISAQENAVAEQQSNQATANKRRLIMTAQAVNLPNLSITSMPGTSKSGIVDLTDEEEPQAKRPQPQAQRLYRLESSNSTQIRPVMSLKPIAPKPNVTIASRTPSATQAIRQIQQLQKKPLTSAPAVRTNLVTKQVPTSNVPSTSQNQVAQNIVARKIATPLKHPAPLPVSKNIQSDPSWKQIPPRPAIRISNIATGIVISWNISDSLNSSAKIEFYQIFAYQETNQEPATSLWRHVGDVKAMLLPMAVTLTQFQEGQRYHFAVRAKDCHGRVGLFSVPRTWD